MSTIVSEIGDLRSSGNVSGNFISTWILKNFSKLDDTPGKLYISRCIHTSAGKYQSCYLQIYPGGEKAGCEGYVSFFLSSHVNYERKLKLEYVIELRNTDEKIITSLAAECTNFCFSWGYPKLIERKTLLPELIDDVLVIQLKATYSVAYVTGVGRATEEYPEMISELICKDMMRLYDEKTGTDVVISVGKEEIPAHYAVLAARSKVFAAMFEHDTTEKSTGRITIEDFDADSVKALLQFMYSGSLGNLTVDLAQDLLRAADKYYMDSLKTYCSNYLISRFDVRNIEDVVVSADTYNALKLRKRAVEFIREHISEFDFRKDESSLEVRDKLQLEISKLIGGDQTDE